MINSSEMKTSAASWVERTDQQKAHEDSAEMDAGEAEAQVNLQPCRAP